MAETNCEIPRRCRIRCRSKRWRKRTAKFPADVAFDADLKGRGRRYAARRATGGRAMRSYVKGLFARASVAIAAGVIAFAGAASTADAQNWNGWVPYNGYNSSSPYPYYNRSMDPGWTWGERYGAPPYGAYDQGRGYYHRPQNSYPAPYYGNGGNAAGQLGGLFVR